MNDKDAGWISDRDQSSAANRDTARGLADTYKGLREEGLPVFEASLAAGAYWGHIMLGMYKDQQKEGS